MRVLVTGGTGFLGGHVARSLQARGDFVRVLGRNPVQCDRLQAEGIEVVRGDLRDEEQVLAACKGMEAVVHAGAFSAPWGAKSDFEAVNVAGTQYVIEGCRQSRVRRLVYISSPSVMFEGRNQVNATEGGRYARPFMSRYSRTKARGENYVLIAGGWAGHKKRWEDVAPQMETVILRPKAIFGPGDTSLLPRLIAAAQRNRLPQIGNGANRVDLTYVDNVVHAVTLSLTRAEASGGIYTITNGESPRVWDVIRRVLRELGLNDRLRQVPYHVAYAIAACMEAKSALTGREPLLTRYTVAVLGRTQTYDISAARRDLNYAPQVSLEDGIERAIAAIKEGPAAPGI